MAEPEAAGDVGVDVVEGDGRRRLGGLGEEAPDITRFVRDLSRSVRSATMSPPKLLQN